MQAHKNPLKPIKLVAHIKWGFGVFILDLRHSAKIRV